MRHLVGENSLPIQYHFWKRGLPPSSPSAALVVLHLRQHKTKKRNDQEIQFRIFLLVNIMLRLCFRPRRYRHLPVPRSFSSSSSENPAEPPHNVINSHITLPQPPIVPHHHHNNSVVTTTANTSSRYSVLGISLVSAIIASVALYSSNDQTNPSHSSNPLHSAIERTISKSNESFRRLCYHVRQTGVAASVLWQSLRSVLSSANHEVRVGFELRVAALLADIAAANGARRAALVGAGGGKVVDWLLETVAVGGGTQAEAARALAYLIADPNVCGDVLGRPHAVPYLLRFIFTCQPKKKHSGRSSFDISDSLKGRSMLVAAIMDIVTSHSDTILEKVPFKSTLPGNAETRDIAAAIEVIEEGGLHIDEPQDKDTDDNGGSGMKGIGIKILEGTTVLGLARNSELAEFENSNVESFSQTPKTLSMLLKQDGGLAQNLSSAVVPGLWDDLHCQHVAVPFAAWALANWAMASDVNRSHIQELDQDGQAVMTALMAPERSVKWHGSLVARLLLEDRNLPLNDSVSDWSSSLLTTVSQASKNDDIPLAQVALSAFLLSVERCPGARKIVMDKGLELMRNTAKQTTKYRQVQEALARVLELLYAGDMHLSLQESQKWSGILLPWVFGKVASDTLRSSATKILSCILEDHGPSSVPISQGWLTILLNEVLASSKASFSKGGTQPRSDKVKTQIDKSNTLFAAQTANQLAGAVVNLAGNQLGAAANSVDTFPLADLLSLEPFAGPFQNFKKDATSKFNVADSAVATLKGIKALTELCSEDSVCQNKITELGVFCLLRRFLLCDDYERLSAMEAYDASRSLEAQERVPKVTGETPNAAANYPSSVRVPPTAHIRRHAARLLTVLSHLPKVQKAILEDTTLCKWLEDCANNKIPGCSDCKIQSYSRATLLNVFCCQSSGRESLNSNISEGEGVNSKGGCPHYDDMIFLINPELPHWKRCENMDDKTVEWNKLSLLKTDFIKGDNSSVTRASNVSEYSISANESLHSSESEAPQLDVVFIHGLRGGPYKTWRLSEDKVSTKSGLVEKIDEEAGKLGTFWPAEWLSTDLPQVRMFTLKYKTNLTQWSGATLPLQEVSSMMLEKLVAAGIGNRPVVFVTHSMGGLVVKQMLYKAKTENIKNLVNNTVGIVFYSCPHFGSKLADMPWRMGLVFRPAPTIGELRSGAPRLVELNDYIRHLHKKRLVEVLSFCETKVTPIVEGYGGWAFRMEIVPIESAYPGFGELVVLESTDHINSCKPINRNDPSYTETLEFLRKLKAHNSKRDSASS
ncbi:ribonuclease p/mrp subunit, putative [Ricinus communis]|uniref:Ribonuclease p/mrp subunit, putative n=1 Tax=Ricinus communis TaxID=3988 RepID=B9R7G8_RICCO|nr:ribonuclease p/mrp subunit, putative [Ricinus communis]